MVIGGGCRDTKECSDSLVLSVQSTVADQCCCCQPADQPGESSGRSFLPEWSNVGPGTGKQAAGQLWWISGRFGLPLPLPILDAERVIVEGISVIACYLLFGDW